MARTMDRLPKLKEKTGLQRSTIYRHIELGLLPEPIHVGPRAVAWPSNETETILAARVAGRSDDEIKKLVKLLVAARRDTDAAA